MNTIVQKDKDFLKEASLIYVTKQKEVIQSFVWGCIQLGGILDEYHTILKEKKMWGSFLEEININRSMANQQLRLFHYSHDVKQKELLKKVITNWNKLNMFLALDDEKKVELLGSDAIDEHSSNQEFKEVIQEIKGEETYAEIGESTHIDINNIDIEATAKSMKSNLGTSENSVDAIQGVLTIAKGINKIQTAKINDNDKINIKNLLSEQMNSLNLLLDTL